MRRPLRRLIVAAWLATTCHGGLSLSKRGESMPLEAVAGALSPAVLAATMRDCDRLAVHDSGRVVYVVVDRACATGATPHRFRLLMRGGGLPAGPAVQLDMQEGDERDGVVIPGLGERRVGLFRTGQWRRIENNDSWQRRDGAGLLLLDGEFFLLGGWTWGPLTSEVWKTHDLVHWEFLGDAPWPARHGAAWLVHDGKLWVIGGDLHDDVWSSPDGVHWTQQTRAAPFGKRYTPNAASIGDRIVVYAGQSWRSAASCGPANSPCVPEAPRDVWSSADGRNWQLMSAQAPWEGRGLIHGSIVHDGEIFLIGGGIKAVPPGQNFSQTVVEYRDIWSSRDGSQWTRRSEAFSFAPRTHFSVVATPQGCYVSNGAVGTQTAVSRSLFFAADCMNFAPVPDMPPLKPRHADSLAYFNGSLVILGGPPIGGSTTAVWQYFP